MPSLGTADAAVRERQRSVKKKRIMRIRPTALTVLALLAFTLNASARDDDGSWLGRPVTCLLPPGALDPDQYEIKVSQTKGGTITEADARYALEHSELIDPTLECVRHSDFPGGATLTLISKANPQTKVSIRLSSLGLHTINPITYVFRYKLPPKQGGEGKADKPQNEPSEAATTSERDRAVSLAIAYVKKQNGQREYVLTAPVEVKESSTCWVVSFGRPPDRQADPACGVVRVDKQTREVTWIPQK